MEFLCKNSESKILNEKISICPFMQKQCMNGLTHLKACLSIQLKKVSTYLFSNHQQNHGHASSQSFEPVI